MQEAEERCCCSSLIKTPDRTLERPPRDGLSVFRAPHAHVMNPVAFRVR